MSTRYVGDVMNRIWQAPWGEVVAGLLSSSVVCAAAAIVIALAMASIGRGRRFAPTVPVAKGERVALAAVALAVGGAWIVDVVVRGYVFDMSHMVSWWRFAVAPATAAAGLLAVGLTMRARSPRRAAAAASVSRRTWTTFGPRRGIVVFAVLTAATAAIVVVFGRMSTAFDPGLSAHVALTAPNTTDVATVTPFPGWAYGIPVAAALSMLAAAAVFALHRNAVRPFTESIPLDLERSHRAAMAGAVVWTSVGATMLALAGLLRMARAGAVTTASVMTDTGRDALVLVRLPHEDLILVGGSLAPLIEIFGGVVLVVTVSRGTAFVRGAWQRAVGAPAESA